MKYNFEKKVMISETSPRILGHGYQGTVLEIGNSAYKTYNLCSRRRTDDKDVAIRLSKLNLKRFVVPYSLHINRKGSLLGFKMRLLKANRENKLTTDMNIDDVVRDVKEIREEAKIISENGIVFNDLESHNVMVTDNGIVIYDFSAYGVSDSPTIADDNNAEIDNLFGSFLLTTEMPDVDSILLYDIIYGNYKRSGCGTIEEYYERFIPSGSIREYVLKKTKTK